MCSLMQKQIERVGSKKPFKGIVGVPYAALPYASVSCISLFHGSMGSRKCYKAAFLIKSQCYGQNMSLLLSEKSTVGNTTF